MISDTSYPKPSAQVLVRVMEHFGVRDVVMSPGTRDMPLLLACDMSPNLRTHSVIDERCAGFMALGIAASSNRPVALICTSGTAMLNYAPALAEAYYRHIPLIAVSADRPTEWIDQADSQTMRQPEALAAVVKKSVNIPEFNPTDSDKERFATRLICDAIGCALRVPKGPVHINIPFDVPLGPVYPQLDNLQIPEILYSHPTVPTESIKKLVSELGDKKILIVAGMMSPDNRLNKAFVRLTTIPGVVVLAESLSNLHCDNIITNIDATLGYLKNEIKNAKPDVVIICGGALVSAKLKHYLRSLKVIEQWCVAPYADTLQDTFRTLSLAIEAEPTRFFPTFASLLGRKRKENKDNSYNSLWWKASSKAASEFESFVTEAPWSELKAVTLILRLIPEKFNLHFSNGTAIRYGLLNPPANIHAISCNRGVSGIEGSTSTALGAALTYSCPTLLITGDMSFSYDIGALAQRNIPDNFKIVVLSNSGGGIFRVIDKTSAISKREELFCVPPNLPLKELAEAYGFHYIAIDCEEGAEEIIESFLSENDKPTILNIIVNPEISAEVFRKYNSTL